MFKIIKKLFCKHKWEGALFLYRNCKYCGKRVSPRIWKEILKRNPDWRPLNADELKDIKRFRIVRIAPWNEQVEIFRYYQHIGEALMDFPNASIIEEQPN